MTPRNRGKATWKSSLLGGLVCAAVGVALLCAGGWPLLLSYDLLFLFRRAPAFHDMVVVYMDEPSFAELGQTSVEHWDRNLHAQLLDRLTQDRSRLVVFDIVFSEPGTPSANTNFTAAIQRNGHVVLAASLDYQSRPQIKVKGPTLPLEEFEAAAAGWGIAELARGPGEIARQYYHNPQGAPSLPWIAAKLAAPGAGPISDAASEPAWIHYYGPPFTIPSLSYREVTHQPAGYFRDKIVFVGARPKTAHAHDEVDEFRTPYTLWTGALSPGVEISATVFLNFLRNDAFTRTRTMTELLLLVAAGTVLGTVCGLLRPLSAAAVALAATILIVIIALQAASRHLWFPWTVLAFAQVPVALAWSWRGHFHRLTFEHKVLERTLEETSRLSQATAGIGNTRKTGIEIPDHTLVRCVGQGAYGQVWLAKNAIGAFHAVKIVQRRAFSSDQPYEREFKGIQKFMPISRSHPGLVHVLHVGRNDATGFFFYIMEAGDDQTSGQTIDPERYSPKTLATELAWRGRLPPADCLELGLALSTALEHLHQQQLVHRDIKPGNIIYVHGAPKFADIGLVTDLAPAGQGISCVGTEGYIPPEGPGTPAADVYALGKVLYEACMGRDRLLFPEVPTAVLEQASDGLLRRLNELICRACATQLQERFQTAHDLHSQLLKLHASRVQ